MTCKSRNKNLFLKNCADVGLKVYETHGNTSSMKDETGVLYITFTNVVDLGV